MNKCIIKKEEFDKLFDGNITVREYNEIISKIDLRFQEICHLFLQKRDKTRFWFDYYGEQGFVPSNNLNSIEITGEWISPPEGFDLNFPTNWLWEENWHEQMEKTTQDYLLEKSKEELKKSLKKMKSKDSLIKSIKKKLTEKELEIIEFKE